MKYKVISSHNIGFYAPGSVLSELDIEAAGGSVPHLVAAGHIVEVNDLSAAKARKATSVIKADEAEPFEEQ